MLLCILDQSIRHFGVSMYNIPLLVGIVYHIKQGCIDLSLRIFQRYADLFGQIGIGLIPTDLSPGTYRDGAGVISSVRRRLLLPPSWNAWQKDSNHADFLHRAYG